MPDINQTITDARASKLQQSKAIMDRLEFDYSRLCANCTWNQRGMCREPLVSNLHIENGKPVSCERSVNYARMQGDLCGPDGDLWAPARRRQQIGRMLHRNRAKIGWGIAVSAYIGLAIWIGLSFGIGGVASLLFISFIIFIMSL